MDNQTIGCLIAIVMLGAKNIFDVVENNKLRKIIECQNNLINLLLDRLKKECNKGE